MTLGAGGLLFATLALAGAGGFGAGAGGFGAEAGGFGA